MIKWLLQLFRHPQPTTPNEERFDKLNESPLGAHGVTPELPYDENEPIRLPIRAELDLHTFSPRDIADVTSSYLEEAHRANFSQVRVIHGKGKGVQREIVHAMLRQHPLVQSFQLAPPEQGGWGATIVWFVTSPEEGTA
jgi:dsDNA-specific endonuclease/ATPase MutS2